MVCQRSHSCGRVLPPRLRIGIPDLQNDVDAPTGLAMRKLHLQASSSTSYSTLHRLLVSMPENCRSIQRRHSLSFQVKMRFQSFREVELIMQRAFGLDIPQTLEDVCV